MKKIYGLLIALASILSFSSLTKAFDITTFESDIHVDKNQSVTITESITADFTKDPHHGIFRFIPNDEKKYPIELLSVTDENTQPLHYENFSKDGDLNIKIGNADILIEKPVTYKITYRFKNILQDLKDKKQLYLNITGNDWDIPIKETNATITLPIETQDIKTTCFTGTPESKDKNCSTDVKNNRVKITTKTLEPGEGLSIMVDVPETYFEKNDEKSFWQIFLQALFNLL